MPFVQRVVEPKYLSRGSLWDEDGTAKVTDGELDALTNNTLSNALRQLASVLLVADDIFKVLGGDLQQIAQRSQKLKKRMSLVEEKVAAYDPKKVTVPESDISSFALLRHHYTAKQEYSTSLFSVETRPNSVQQLYKAAAKTPVHLMRQMDKWRKDGHRSSKFFLCTPVLGRRKKIIRNRVDDIETRLPAAVEELRRWTSNEALGDITIPTDCQSRIPNVTAASDGDITDGTVLSDDEAIDHKLPSPEEQQHVIALKFPPEVVAVDVSGRNFDRMSIQRRSLLHTETEDGSTIRRKTKTRRSRSKRRNTLAGTDEKEIVDALAGGEETQAIQLDVSAPPTVGVVNRSKSSDLLRSSTKKESLETKKSHFDSLKQWGKNRLKMLNKYTESKSPENTKKEEEDNLYETVTVKRKRNIDKERKILHQRQASCSSSEKSGIATPQVKLRDSSLQRRLRRSGENKDEPHSSSGNWSASSESGRASIGSEITTHPKSTTSAATSINSLNIHPPGSVNSKRRYNINTSASGSVTSEGTLTPDIIHDLHEDGETSSVYSCDTEGYYTSFHMDSGLKTLKEEDSPQTPQHSSTVFTNSSTSTVLTAENEYELFGRGSTSTTTSSAGTVCTTLRASNRSINLGPAVPERKSSLNPERTSSTNPERKSFSKDKSPGSSLERDCSSSEKTGTVKRSPLHQGHKATVVAVIHKNGDVSPDSGHNTSSSPIESTSSPNGNRSCSEFEFSESSDMEGTERIERIRVKTTINSSRIPSMCAITPPHSDDESIKNFDTIHEKNQINQKSIDVEANLNGLDILKETTTWNSKVHLINVNPKTGYATIENIEDKIKASLVPLNNMLGKIKTNWNNLSSKKGTQEPSCKTQEASNQGSYNQGGYNQDDGDYVTIADVKNNNDMINRNLKTVLSGKIKETEYVSLNELPGNESFDNSLDRKRRHGARVTLNAEGKVVYTSDSLPRRKSTTFEPGPFVKAKDSPTTSPVSSHRNLNIRPVANISGVSTPLSPQLGKVVIKANSGTTEIVRMQPSTIVRPMSPKSTNSRAGAYVHMLDTQSDVDEGQAVSPTSDQAILREKMMETDLQRRTYQPRVTYNTLPTKRTSYILNEPDITRDLGTRRYETLGRIGQDYRKDQDYRKGLYDPGYEEIGIPITQGRHFGIPVQMPSIAPNYTSSQNYRPNLDDSLKISPIDPRQEAGFKSSTPSGRDLKSSVNLSNLLSPKKSTMSNDELYAVIHKGKKKLNINDTFEAVEPTNTETTKKLQNPESGYLDKAKSRLSWSPSSSKEPNKSPSIESRSRQSWAVPDKKPKSQTSTLDFKRLLLQHCRPNLPPSNTKLSAVEQLKLSKQQVQTQQGQTQPNQPRNQTDSPDLSILELSRSPRSIGHRKLNNPQGVNLPKTPEKQRPAPKILSPRSQWRFASPRSDVLSSTIVEEESPNSSTERKKSPQQTTSTNNKTDSNCSRSLSEKLQARRAQFFNSDRGTVDRNAQEEKPVLPTLETSF